MFRVIETIRFDEKTAPYTDVLENLGCGLLVVIDLAQLTTPPIDCNTIIRVHRPDGSSFDTVVKAIEVWGPKVGLFFQNLEKYEIPLSSEIELIAA